MSSTAATFKSKSCGQTSNEMCSLPSRISSSCRPSLFFSGHLVSSSLRRLLAKITLDEYQCVLHDFALFDYALNLCDKE